MAKDKDAVSAVSSESKDFLEQAKKGKPRKFAMICKGTNIISLVVFKKGSYEKRKKEAKESGKGQFCFGVINGQGMDLQFTLARSDGFESEPVKALVLKSFLDESADFKCKPTFVIVDQLATVLDEDDPLVQRFLELRGQIADALVSADVKRELGQLSVDIAKHFDSEEVSAAGLKIEKMSGLLSNPNAIPEPPPVPPPPPAPPAPDAAAAPTAPATASGGLALKLQDALSKLKPLLEQAITLQPQRKIELLSAVKRAKDSLGKNLVEQAQNEIVQLGRELKAIVSSPITPPVTAKTDPAQTAYQQLLPSVLEMMNKAGSKVPDKLPKLQKVLQIATDQAEKGDFTGALGGLEKLKTALLGIVDQPIGGDDLAGQYQLRMESLEPQLLKVLGQMTGDSSKLRAVSEFAREKAASGDFVSALKALDRLAPMVEQASASGAPKETDVIAKGIVAAMKLKLEEAKRNWDSAVVKGIDAVGKIQASLQDDDPELAQALSVTMNAYRGRMDVVAAQAKKLESNTDVQSARAKVIQALFVLENEIEDDELLAHIARHETVQVDVAAPLLEALSQIEQSLPN